MATVYVTKATVLCHNCGTGMTKRRTSASGYYYCQKPECQTARRKGWLKDQGGAELKRAKEAHDAALVNGARFLEAALRAERIVCPACGLKNALRGYGHFDVIGNPCGELGGKVEGVTLAHALAVWPLDKREYETF